MAWVHFTSPLAAGDILTKDQRDELLDALEERVIASGRSYHADMAGVRASEILSRSVRTTGAAYLWDSLLTTLAVDYFEDTSAGIKYSLTSFRAAIATALGGGLTGTDVSSIFSAGSAWSVANYWNAIREGIRLLQAVEPWVMAPTVTDVRKSANASTWTAAKSAFISASEDSTIIAPLIVTTEAPFSTSYGVQGRRRQTIYAIPAVACFSNGYEFWVFASQGTSAGSMPTITIRVKHSGTNYDVTPPSGGGYSRVTIPSLTATGSAALTFDIIAKAFEDATELDTFPTPAASSTNSRTPGFIHAVKPTFTHP